MSHFMISEPLNNNYLKRSPFSNIYQRDGPDDHDLTTYVSSNCLDLLLYILTDHMELDLKRSSVFYRNTETKYRNRNRSTEFGICFHFVSVSVFRFG